MDWLQFQSTLAHCLFSSTYVLSCDFVFWRFSCMSKQFMWRFEFWFSVFSVFSVFSAVCCPQASRCRKIRYCCKIVAKSGKSSLWWPSSVPIAKIPSLGAVSAMKRGWKEQTHGHPTTNRENTRAANAAMIGARNTAWRSAELHIWKPSLGYALSVDLGCLTRWQQQPLIPSRLQ